MAKVIGRVELPLHRRGQVAKIKLTFERLEDKSPICVGPDHPQLPLLFADWLNKVCGKSGADYAIVARVKSGIVGFVRWDREDDRVLMLGTYVKSGYRGRGLAGLMWKHAVRHFNLDAIDVTTTSPAGAGLVQALQKKYEDYQWLVSSV